MGAGYVSALAALAGSAIGALASFGTTWLTQHTQTRAQQIVQDRTRREALYGDFIDEASRLFADALAHDLDDAGKLVRLYAILSRIRLFSSPEILEKADVVMHAIIDTYYAPNRDFHKRSDLDDHAVDPLRMFSESCRADLRSTRLPP
jgi:hypothetical protein